MADGSHSFNFPAPQQFTYAELRDRVDEIDLKDMGVEA